MIQNFKTFLTEQKNNFNRGDVAEAIFAAAMASRFVKPVEEKIEQKDVEGMLRKLLEKQEGVTKRADADGVTIDEITLKISIPSKSMSFIKVRNNWSLVSDIFASCIEYVNNNVRLRRQARTYFRNNKANKIEIRADGTKDQKGTKIDIFLEFDGKRSVNQVSLKTAGGEQFGQVGGQSFDKQERLWKEGFDIDLRSLKNSFEKDCSGFTNADYESREDAGLKSQKQILKDAIRNLFKKIASEINRLDAEGKIDLIEALIKFIRKYAAGDESKYIEFVKLEKSKAKALRFEKSFEKKIRKYRFSAQFKEVGDPTILIREVSNGKDLIQIRYKIEAASAKKSGKKVYRIYPRTLFELPTKSILYEL